MFQNQEFANMFDPHRLLKCTYNIFQKHDVANVVSRIWREETNKMQQLDVYY